jgi:hypothetical protein
MNNRYVIIIILTVIIILLLGVVCSPSIFETMENTYNASKNSVPISIPSDGMITPGYYRVPDTSVMQPIPFGSKLQNIDASGNGTLVNKTITEIMRDKQNLDTSNSDLSPKYNGDNYDTEYHDSLDLIAQREESGNIGVNIIDASGNKSIYRFGQLPPPITYNTPPPPIKYVPNYEESVYISRTSGQSQVGSVYNVEPNARGFCAQEANNFDNIDKNCSALGTETCASTSCCVLLGGSKCVAGNINGPLSRSNYIDPFLKNKDLYYYQGKCYGNCEKPGDFVSSV